MEIDQLRAFANLAHTHNFSRTAEVLGLVQSTVSTRIRLLEESVGKPLFTRSKRKVDLTEAGQVFLDYAERILSLCDQAGAKLKALDHFDNRLAVGSTSSLWNHLLAPVLFAFGERFPKTALVTESGGSSRVVQLVLDGVADLGVGYVKPRVAGMRVLTVFVDELLLVISPDHPIRTSKRIGAGDLPRLPLLTFDWDGPTKDWAEKILPPGYTSPVHVDLMSSMIYLLLQKKGAAFVPRTTIEKELKEGSLVPLRLHETLKPPPRKVYAFFKDGMHKSPGVSGWLGLMKEKGLTISR